MGRKRHNLGPDDPIKFRRSEFKRHEIWTDVAGSYTGRTYAFVSEQAIIISGIDTFRTALTAIKSGDGLLSADSESDAMIIDLWDQVGEFYPRQSFVTGLRREPCVAHSTGFYGGDLFDQGRKIALMTLDSSSAMNLAERLERDLRDEPDFESLAVDDRFVTVGIWGQHYMPGKRLRAIVKWSRRKPE